MNDELATGGTPRPAAPFSVLAAPSGAWSQLHWFCGSSKMSFGARELRLLIGIASIVLASSVQAQTPSSELVQVQTRRVEIKVDGVGDPTVIFESGFAGGLPLWTPAQDRVSKITRTLSYERAGLGQSDPGPEPRSAGQIARELHALLAARDIAPPYVLVGHSAGGLFVRVFAHLYPREIVGLVLVDPATEDDYERLRTEKSVEDLRAMGAPAALIGQWLALPETIDEARHSWPLPHVPTVVLTSGKPLGAWPLATAQDMQRWQDSHNQFAKKIPDSRHVLLQDANHMTILKEDAVAEQILETVAAARRHRNIK